MFRNKCASAAKYQLIDVKHARPKSARHVSNVSRAKCRVNYAQRKWTWSHSQMNGLINQAPWADHTPISQWHVPISCKIRHPRGQHFLIFNLELSKLYMYLNFTFWRNHLLQSLIKLRDYYVRQLFGIYLTEAIK